MGNKVRIERICEFCGKTFIAKTCKTRFCCKACNDKYYKELIRSDRYNAVTKEVKEEKKKRIRLAVDELEVIQAREFISLKQLAIYLGVSRKSIYTYMRIYEIPFSQIGSRIIVKRKEVETVMMNLKSVKTMQERPIKSTKTITDFYSAKEIEEKYQISYSRLYVIAKENNIPSATLSGKRLFSMEHIDRYFRKLGYKEAEEITEWYTIEQIQKIYKMTVKAVHSFTSRYKIPKKKEKTGNTTLYSKKHVDEIKNARIGEDGYITVPEACALFNVDRDTIYNRCKWYNIPKKGLLAHFTQIYHLYNLLIYNILRRNLQLFITEFCIFSPCIIFISNKNSDKSIEILHISPKYITSVDNLMIHIFSSTFNFLYSFTPSDRLESKS